MNRPLNALFVFALTTLLTTALSAHASNAPANSVVDLDPYVMTLSAVLLRSPAEPTYYQLAALPGRDQIPIFGKTPALNFAFFRAAKSTAPLVFVVPGLGGLSDDGAALYLADLIHHAGNNVAVVANPFSWKFVLKRSPEAVPGYVPEEAELLAKMMTDVEAHLATIGIHPTSVSAVGYSLGAIDLGFLEMAEARGELKNPVGLSRAVMINPPLDLSFALDRIERLERFRDQLTKAQQDSTWGAMISKVSTLQPPKAGENLVDFMLTAIKDTKVSRSQAAFLIGENFRSSLAELIVVSQSVHDRGLLKQPMSEYHRNAREFEASNILYGTYMRNFMMPFWQQREGTNFDDSGFVAQGSLVKFTSELAALPALRLIHAADDFLTSPADLAKVDTALGARSIIFPHGGHVGNLWEPSVQRAIVGALR